VREREKFSHCRHAVELHSAITRTAATRKRSAVGTECQSCHTIFMAHEGGEFLSFDGIPDPHGSDFVADS
jgi:hypothetical protein